MTRTTRTLAALLLGGVAAFSAGCTATRAFHDAEREEGRQHWDLAVLGYEKAARLNPGSSQYKISLQRARRAAAFAHYERGKLHRNAGQLDIAAVEFEQAVALDPTNDSAVQDLKRVQAEIEARKAETNGGTPVEQAKARAKGKRAAPPMLVPSSNKPIDLVFPTDTNIKKIYQALSSAAGINVIYDPQLKDDKFSIDIRGVTFQKALETVMRQAGHFYKVIDEKTILIAQDTNQNRKEYEDLVIRTFFLSNGDVKDVSAMVRSILDLRRLGTIPQLNAIVIRDTADKVAVAEKIIDVNDKAKAEVVVDVELLQLNTQKILELGTQLSAYSTTGAIQQITQGPGGSTGSTTSTVTSLPWKDLFKLGISDFNFTVPQITFNFIKNNTDAELLAKPQLRIAEGEKAQLTIGDRVPIPVTTVNTTQAIGQVGVVPITSFQYQDVGIKIDIEPRVHHNKEVTLKLTIEVSNLNGNVKGQNGQDQPIIGTRTITSTIRLKDGETNFLAGLIRKDDSKSKVSLPFLGDIPLLGALFSDTKVQHMRTDLFLTLTPHIVRAPQITEEDLTPIWVGTENNVSFSGLNTRLESPSAPASPFDAPQFEARPKPAAATPPSPTSAPNPGGVIQGSGPTDPFKKEPPPPNPNPSPIKPTPPGGIAPQASLDEKSDALVLTPAREEIGAGEKTVLSLDAAGAVSTLGALELTLEWDPAVAEVTGVAAGPWRDAAGFQNVRFEADRVPGRARVQLGRPVGATGLPTGTLAELTVKGLAPGTTFFRVSTVAAANARGAVSLTATNAPITVR